MRLILFIFSILCIADAFAQGATRLDPKLKFEVFVSPHFEIIFASENRDLAKRYILAAEQAYELLIPIFKEAPEKTYIVLKDDTDIANGMATFLPYPQIVVFPVLPSIFNGNEYGNWTLEMVIHEYTHILNIYSAHSFYRPLSWIFGNVVRPNAVLPRWYLEGLAVNLESRLTTHGRLRASETMASARALVLGGKLRAEDIARINETDIPSFPYGGRPYLYGGWWWEDVHREKGADIVYTWNQNYSRRLPFLLNGPMQEQTGKSASENLNATYDRLDKQAREQIAAIEATSVHKGQDLLSEKGEQTLFAVSPSGNRLVYWLTTPGQGSIVKMKTRTQSGQPFHEIEGEQLFKSHGANRVSWLDEDNLLLDQIDDVHPYRTFHDLHAFNVLDRRWTRLTRDARALDPALSPSGKYIAFIQNDAGKTRLALLERETGRIRILLNSRIDQRMSTPGFLSDTEILFVLRNRSGAERLHVYDFQSRITSPWSSPLTSTQNLRKTSAGWMMTDSGTRVRNAYIVHPDGKFEAVTNTLTDVNAADFDPQRKEVLFTELTADGWRLRAVPRSHFAPPTLKAAPIPPPPEPTTTKLRLKQDDYQPLAYMWPRYWIPFIYQVEGGLLFQGLTAANDPAGRNAYSLSGSYDNVTRKGSYGGAFSNHSLPVDIDLSYNRSQSYLGASGLTIESQSARTTLSHPVGSRYRQAELGALWSSTEGSTTINRIGPQAGFTYSRLSGPLVDRFGYHAELSHTQYLEQGDYLAYGRTYGHLATNIHLGGKHKLWLQGHGVVAPDLPLNRVVVLGDRSLGGNYLVNLAQSQFLLRGYPSGTFVGRKLVNTNLEYILPARQLDRGFGTFPFFLKNVELVLFTDALSVDGAGYDIEREQYLRSHLSEYYVSSGAEFRVSTNMSYYMPVSFTLGLYYGFTDRFGGGFSPFLGIGLGDLSGLSL